MCLACEADALWELYLAQRAERLATKVLPTDGDGNGVGVDAEADTAATGRASVAALGCDDPADE